MSTSSNKISGKGSQDPFDKLIFEKNLRIKKLILDQEMDLMIVLLNNGMLIKLRISDYSLLKKATKHELENYSLINDGVGIHWPDIDEDLSLKGFIKTSALNNALRRLEDNATTKLM